LAKLQARAWLSLHFARLANTLLKIEESARDNHVLGCNFAKYLPVYKKNSLTDSAINLSWFDYIKPSGVHPSIRMSVFCLSGIFSSVNAVIIVACRNKPVFSFLRRLTTRHCSHLLRRAVLLLRSPLSIDISCSPGPQQPTRRTGIR